MVGTQPRAKLTSRFDEATDGGKRKYGQLALSVTTMKRARARRVAHYLFRFGARG
jgi:hypothetical protein